MSLAPTYYAHPSNRSLPLPAKRNAKKMRRRMFRIVLFVIGGALLTCALGLPARAAGAHTLVIPLEDGYGFQDCLRNKRPCGFVVADAWCEAHGLAPSKAFGRAEDMAATATDVSLTDLRPGSFLVTCGETRD